MPKITKKRSKSQVNHLVKNLKVYLIIVFAIIGALAIAGIFAQSNSKNYSLKVPIVNTVISLENEKPLVISKDKNGRIKYESRGKSINVTTAGTIYCIPENDGAVKIAEISQNQLNNTTKQIKNNRPTAGTTEQKGLRTSVGNKKQLQFTEEDGSKTIEGNLTQPAGGLAVTEKILDQICSTATKTIPDSQVPVFTPNEVNTKEFLQSSARSPLSYISPKVSAASAPTISRTVESHQINSINYERGKRGLQKLAKSECLTKAARKWSTNMAIVNKLYHSSLANNVEAECGRDWWQKLGENVGMSADSAQVFQAYMNSPGHRANILDKAYQRVGVGAAYYKHPNSPYTILWTTHLFAQCIGSCANK